MHIGLTEVVKLKPCFKKFFGYCDTKISYHHEDNFNAKPHPRYISGYHPSSPSLNPPGTFFSHYQPHNKLAFKGVHVD